MQIAIGCDHRGFKLKQYVMELLVEDGHTYQDFGCHSAEAVDYPDIAREVGRAVASGDFEKGILICATGIGMCIAANKIKGIRAALCYDVFCATRARQHNDANILCLGAHNRRSRIRAIVTAFLTQPFEGGRHQQRLDKISNLEQ
ncbi:MAG: ribose 5-phosphate isomerase B [Dehalococcoidales bacterium]|nr:ribose 5-phosphate isomerase B [Dehalococcoidales bacterium]